MLYPVEVLRPLNVDRNGHRPNRITNSVLKRLTVQADLVKPLMIIADGRFIIMEMPARGLGNPVSRNARLHGIIAVYEPEQPQESRTLVAVELAFCLVNARCQIIGIHLLRVVGKQVRRHEAANGNSYLRVEALETTAREELVLPLYASCKAVFPGLPKGFEDGPRFSVVIVVGEIDEVLVAPGAVALHDKRAVCV